MEGDHATLSEVRTSRGASSVPQDNPMDTRLQSGVIERTPPTKLPGGLSLIVTVVLLVSASLHVTVVKG